MNKIKYTVYPENSKKIDYEFEAHLYDDPDEFYIDYQEEFEDEDAAYLHWEYFH